MQVRTDQELMAMTVQKDTKAFRVLFERYQHAIYNYILRYTGNREIAQDLLQETFTRVWYAAHTFDQKRGYFRAWLYKIALNITRNEMSKKHYTYQFSDINDQVTRGSQSMVADTKTDNRVIQKELKAQVAEALGELKPILREILILRHYQQLKFREIAQMTNTPEGTLKARYHRAIDQMKTKMEHWER